MQFRIKERNLNIVSYITQTRRRNEELQQQAEAKKKEAKRKRQEEDERRNQEKRDQQERDRQERQVTMGTVHSKSKCYRKDKEFYKPIRR